MKCFAFPVRHRRKFCFVLPLCISLGALIEVAHAQSTVATQPPSAASFFSQLFSSFGAIAMIALIVGYFKPNAFRFLFKDKATKSVVCGAFGVAMLLLGGIGSALEPKPIVTAQETAAQRAQMKAERDSREALRRAKVAEDRAIKAEKAAATAQVPETRPTVERAAVMPQVKDDAITKQPQIPSGSEQLPPNVVVANIRGVGKRQVGEVDRVQYVVLGLEKVSNIGGTNADGLFYVLRMAASNTDKKTHNVTTSLMKMIDDQAREFDPSRQGGTALVLSGDSTAQIFSAQVQPGVVKKFTLVYDAPADASGLKLKIPAGTFSLRRGATIKVPTEGDYE